MAKSWPSTRFIAVSADRLKPRNKIGFRGWLHRAFLLWAVFSMSWLANSVRTRGVDGRLLRASSSVSVRDDATTLAFLPTSSEGASALIFICGSGVTAAAYAPLLRPIAEAGHPVFVVKLPYRFAPLQSHKQGAVNSAGGVVAAHPQVANWVISGHSLGAALAARMAGSAPPSLSALVLIGTTHPKEHDLSFLRIPVTKVYASNDGIAPPERVLANRGLLPPQTKWVEIVGGNHSQFGRYGRQLFDGAATISRDAQEMATRAALLDALAGAETR